MSHASKPIESHRRSVRIVAIVTAAIGLLLAGETSAQGWNFSIGAATIVQPVYPGSRHSYVVPMVSLRAEYARGTMTARASFLDGIGVDYVDLKRHLLLSFNLNQGDERRSTVYSIAGFEVDHGESTRRLLSGSPDLSNPVNATALLGYLTPIGVLSISAAYHPTKVKFANGDELEHGLLYSVAYMTGIPITPRLAISSVVSVDFMDEQFANAWYTAEQGNDVHESFGAGAGLRDVQIAAQIDYRFTESVSASCLAAHTRLLGDAGDSPFTTARDQFAAILQVDYRF